MTTYTTVADSNGDFIVPFSTEYSSGEKVTVTAEKDGAIKTIELFAPSEVTGGGVIQFSGTLDEFPKHIGVITLSQIYGHIESYAFMAATSGSSIFRMATGLILPQGITSIGEACFAYWYSSQSIYLPPGLSEIDELAFMSWQNLTSLEIPESITQIKSSAFYDCPKLQEVIVKSITPPALGSNAFQATHPSLAIKVPPESVDLYKASSGWSFYGERIQAI